MHTTLRFVLALLASLLVANVGDAATGYVRPRVSYFKPTTTGADATVAGFLGAGFACGAKGSHEFEIEVGWASWERDMAGVDDGATPYRAHSENDFVPVLLNYRYRIGSPDAVSVYVEIGLGAAPVSADWTIEHDEGAPVRGRDQDTGVLAAAGAGLCWKVGANTALLVGIRHLLVRAPGRGLLNDYEITQIDGNAVSFEAGLRLRF